MATTYGNTGSMGHTGTLGNTGSAALPSALALAAEQGALRSGQKAALLGIGSGLNCLMLAVEW